MNTLVTVPKRSRSETRRSDDSMPRFSSWVDNFFDNELGTGFLSNFNTGMSLPAVNILENPDNFLLEIAVPGMEKDDFKIDLDNKILSISSEKDSESHEHKGNYTRREFGYASFKRTFTLPDSVNADKIQANYKNGILSVELPKREEAKQKPPRQVKIS